MTSKELIQELGIWETIKNYCDFSLWDDVLSIMPKEEHRYDYEDDVYTSVVLSERDKKKIKNWLEKR